MLRLDFIEEFQIKSSVSKSESESRGIIYKVPTNNTEEDLLHLLADQGVKCVKRFHKTKPDNTRCPLTTVAITFTSPTLPAEIVIAHQLWFIVKKPLYEEASTKKPEWLLASLRVNRNPSAENSSHIQEETAYISSETEEDIPNCGSSEDDDDEPRRTPRPESITIEIPAKNLSKVTAQVAESRNITIRDHLTIQSSFVNAGSGNITDMSLSLSTVHRHRRQMRQEISGHIREKWIPPPFLLIH